MRETIRRLFGSSIFLVLCSAACLYLGSQRAASATSSQAANELARQFGGDPGDGFMLAGGMLMLVARASVSSAFVKLPFGL
jgi:hypothetical protein